MNKWDWNNCADCKNKLNKQKTKWILDRGLLCQECFDIERDRA